MLISVFKLHKVKYCSLNVMHFFLLDQGQFIILKSYVQRSFGDLFCVAIIKKLFISCIFCLSIFLWVENLKMQALYSHIGFSFTKIRKFTMTVPTTTVSWSQIYISYFTGYFLKFLCSYKVKAAYQKEFLVISAQYFQS